MSHGIETGNLKRMPQWMRDPQNRKVALDTLRTVKPHRAYAEIAKALVRERKLAVEPIEINTFAFANRKDDEAGPEWLRKYLASSLGEEDTPPLHPVPAKEYKKRKTDTDISAANKIAGAARQKEDVGKALARAKSSIDAELQETCAQIFRSLAWGRQETPRHVEISYAQMSVEEKNGAQSVMTMVPGARITISVSVSTSSKGAVSEEARRGYALASVLQKALQTGRLGDRNAEAPLLGYGRIDFCLKAKGKTTLVYRKIVPLEARR